jgi:hypothetical protein
MLSPATVNFAVRSVHGATTVVMAHDLMRDGGRRLRYMNVTFRLIHLTTTMGGKSRFLPMKSSGCSSRDRR